MLRFFGKLYVQVLIGVTAGVLVGVLWPQLGSDLKPLGRRVHQADQDGVRAHHLRDGRPRHRADGKHEGAGARRRSGAHLLRGAVDLCAVDWSDRRQRPPAGSGDEHRPRDARYQGHRELHRQRSKADRHRGFPAEHDPGQRRRCAGQERHPADPGVLDPVRRRAVAHRAACQAGDRLPRLVRPRRLLDRRDDHAPRAACRLRRDGLHGRQVRTGIDCVARQADGGHVRDLLPLRGRGTGHHRARCPASACGSSSSTSRTRSSRCWAPVRRSRWCRS